MELKLIDGDYVPDGAGGFVRADGTEETLERLRDNGYTVHRTDTEGNVSFRVTQERAYGK